MWSITLKVLSKRPQLSDIEIKGNLSLVSGKRCESKVKAQVINLSRCDDVKKTTPKASRIIRKYGFVGVCVVLLKEGWV